MTARIFVKFNCSLCFSSYVVILCLCPFVTSVFQVLLGKHFSCLPAAPGHSWATNQIIENTQMLPLPFDFDKATVQKSTKCCHNQKSYAISGSEFILYQARFIRKIGGNGICVFCQLKNKDELILPMKGGSQ